MVKFISLSSGSNGNCYYIGNDEVSILIDAGIGPRTIKKRLSEYGISFDKINLVLITHDHVDHIRGLYALADRENIPVFATKKLYNSILNFTRFGYKLKAHVNFTVIGSPSTFKGVSFTPFLVPHDATETVGYYIDFYGVKFTFITDAGAVTENVLHYCSIANVLILESNYDTNMLYNGSYPKELQNRITSGNGHLSNDQTAQTIKQIYRKELGYIYLCHLSENNNTPEKAYNAVSGVLSELNLKIGSDITLECLPRREASKLFLI